METAQERAVIQNNHRKPKGRRQFNFNDYAAKTLSDQTPKQESRNIFELVAAAKIINSQETQIVG
jgi:type II secretory pathway component PulL